MTNSKNHKKTKLFSLNLGYFETKYPSVLDPGSFTIDGVVESFPPPHIIVGDIEHFRQEGIKAINAYADFLIEEEKKENNQEV